MSLEATRARRSLALVLLFSAAHALLRLLPWSPAPVGTDVDDSWSWVFHEVWARALVCGREVDFTYGPYGFLLTESYHPATFATRLWILGAVSLLLVLAAWRIVLAQVASTWAALAWMLLIVEVMALWKAQQNLFPHVHFAILWLDWMLDRRGARSKIDVALLHALAAAAALGTLGKFSFFAGALVAVLAVAWGDVLRRKSFPWILPTFCGALVLLWVLARQPLSALAPYFAISAEIVAGYSEGMSMQSPAFPLALFLAAALLVLALLGWRWSAGRPPGSLSRFLGLAALLFLNFKAAFVGFDAGHSLPVAASLLLWLVAALASRSGRPLRPIGAVTASLALASILLLTRSILVAERLHDAPKSLVDLVVSPLRQARDALGVVTGSSGLEARHERTLQEIRSRMPLPPLTGPVDVYPLRPGFALAHGLDYRPRPVFQSYCAYTPNLLRLNAEHLASARGPDTVLLNLADWIARRPPSMADSLSWPILLARYEVVGLWSEHLVLLKRTLPRTIDLEPLESRLVRFGDTVPMPLVPKGAGLWAEVDVRPTLLGRAASFLHHPPILCFGYRLASGRVEVFRLVPGIARAGFLLGPSIVTEDDYRRFSAGDPEVWRSREVRALIVSEWGDGGDTWAYESEYELRLSMLKFGP